MEYPTISVIIPTYNAIDTIQRCIESVLEQTVSISEIIVINDGSTDNTESFLQSYKMNNKLDNLNIITQPNGGPAKARNRGITEARGEWIAFLDADDRWLPQKIGRQVEMISIYPEVSIIGTNLFSPISEQKVVSINKIAFTGMLFKNMLFTSSVIVRKNVVEQYYFDEDKKYSEDYKLWLQIIQFHKGIVLCEGLVVYAENQNKYKRKALSNDLWKMEINQLDNYYYFYKKQAINIFLLVVIIAFSFLKFFKRSLHSIF